MSDKKHIDRLFQEKFKDFEAAPSDAVWKNIEAELNQDKKKRRIIPIWWQYTGVAAMLALLLTVGGSYLFKKDTVEQNPINVVDTQDTQTRSSNPSTDTETKIAIESDKGSKKHIEDDSENDSKVTSNTTGESQKSSLANTSTSTYNKEEKHQSSLSSNKKSDVKNNLPVQNKNAVTSVSEEKNTATNTSVAKNLDEKDEIFQNNPTLIKKEKATKLIKNTSKDSVIIAKVENKEKKSLTIEEALDRDKDVVKNDKTSNKWRITPNAAPVYFNSLGEGSSIDPQFNANSKTGEVNMSYGISASYVINDKIKVRSGINKVNLGYNTNNVVEYQSIGVSSYARGFQNIDSNTLSASPSDSSIISGENISSKPESFISKNTSINQALGYIEVPLEIQYALVNNKLGVNLIGGFSSFFLSNNKIYSQAETGTQTYLGEANNINNMSYSANFGIGLNYQVSKKIDLNLEPMFKYQINTFNNTSGDFTPYFIGVYTGFAIKF